MSPPVLLQRQKQSKELILQQERAYPRLYWSLRTALRPLIDSYGQQVDPDLASPVGNSSSSVANSSSGSSCSSSSGSAANNGVNSQQKRQRRVKTNSATTQCQPQEPDEDNDETDEEPVL